MNIVAHSFMSIWKKVSAKSINVDIKSAWLSGYSEWICIDFIHDLLVDEKWSVMVDW